MCHGGGIDWLVEKGQRAVREELRSQGSDRKRRDKNGRRRTAQLKKPIVHFDTGHARHPHIGDETGCFSNVPGLEEGLGRREDVRLSAERALLGTAGCMGVWSTPRDRRVLGRGQS
jgi:hypothetical protein